MATTIYMIVANFLALLAVVSQSHAKPTERLGWRLPKEDPTPVNFNFDFELFKRLTQKQHDNNIVLSPASVKLVLGMLMEGASGETREEIRRALGLGQAQYEVHRKMWKLARAFQKTTDTATLNVANHVYISDSYNIYAHYQDALQIYFHGKVSKLNMSDGVAAANEINKWVQTETHDVIQKLVDETLFEQDIYGMFLNAIYFKAAWKMPFVRASNRYFCQAENQCTKTVFMKKTEELPYAYNRMLNAEIIQLPYSSERFSMLILYRKNGVEELLADLSHESLQNIINEMEPTVLDIHLPRFTAEFKEDLVPVLAELNIRKAFKSSADFSGMIRGVKDGFSVGSLLHSAKIVVDEEGSVAAGASQAQITPLMGGISIIVDRPFIFFITDKETNSILFAGRVSDPDRAISPVIDKVIIPDSNNIPEEMNNKDFAKPGAPGLLPPRTMGRPNGLMSVPISPPSVSSLTPIHWEPIEVNISEPPVYISEAPSPWAVVRTTTHSPPHISETPPSRAVVRTTTQPPPFIRPKSSKKKTTTPSLPLILPDNEYSIARLRKHTRSISPVTTTTPPPFLRPINRKPTTTTTTTTSSTTVSALPPDSDSDEISETDDTERRKANVPPVPTQEETTPATLLVIKKIRCPCVVTYYQKIKTNISNFWG